MGAAASQRIVCGWYDACVLTCAERHSSSPFQPGVDCGCAPRSQSATQQSRSHRCPQLPDVPRLVCHALIDGTPGGRTSAGTLAQYVTQIMLKTHHGCCQLAVFMAAITRAHAHGTQEVRTCRRAGQTCGAGTSGTCSRIGTLRARCPRAGRIIHV